MENKKEEDKEIEEILKDQKVQEAVRESAPSSDKKSKGKTSILGTTTVILVVSSVLFFLLDYGIFPISSTYVPLIQRIFLGTIFITFFLVVNRIVKNVTRKRISDKTTNYNLENIIDLFTILIIFIISLSLFFANWYATMVSFGVVSLILGLALQNPITSFFGWIYLLLRKPYVVGDRIKIGAAYGDVIKVDYLDTTLWEFRGDYLSGDHPSGRIVKFTNSKVFNEHIYNYSWPLFPFIWNELKMYISYDSDLLFTSNTIKRIAEEEVGEAMIRRVKRYKKILSNTLVEELEVRERPSVFLRAHENTWVEVTVRFLVNPKSAGKVKTQLFGRIMEELKQYPDKVIFPNSKTE